VLDHLNIYGSSAPLVWSAHIHVGAIPYGYAPSASSVDHDLRRARILQSSKVAVQGVPGQPVVPGLQNQPLKVLGHLDHPGIVYRSNHRRFPVISGNQHPQILNLGHPGISILIILVLGHESQPSKGLGSAMSAMSSTLTFRFPGPHPVGA